MKKLPTLAIAAATALTIGITSVSAPAYAGKRERGIAAGVLLGALGGALLAGEIHRKRKKRRLHRQNQYGHEYDSRVDDQRIYDVEIYGEPRRVRRERRLSSWERHVRRCHDKYRSYDERSDTFIDRRGRERRCRL